jgi:hypothetical protein
MADNRQLSFVQRRAEALATVLLTSRDDLDVAGSADAPDVQLVATIIRDNRRTGRQLGITVRGTVDPVDSLTSAERVLKAVAPRDWDDVGIYIPLCVFLFSMVQDRGYYAWTYEPSTIKGQAKLLKRVRLECKKLDLAALDEIVARVNMFYDTLSSTLISQSP